MYLLFALAYLYTDWHITPLIPASIINNISTSVNNSKFTFAFFKHACHANPGADKKWEGSSPSWNSPYFLIQILPILFVCAHSLYQ